MLRQLSGIAFARDDVAENAQAGRPGDVADDEGELEIHLHQRFLHALDVVAAISTKVWRWRR